MKLNKTLTHLKNGGTIYGENQLENGEDITTTYCTICN